MPVLIPISGIIGIEPQATAAYVREELQKAAGEDVEYTISSPGGIIYEGLEIFNLFDDYPGQTTSRIIGMAASMASVIPLAAKKRIAKSNAVMMIHDALIPVGIAPSKELRKAADVGDGLSNILAEIYAKATGKTVAEMRESMVEERYLYGRAIADFGFVAEIDEIGVTAPVIEAKAIIDAKAQVALCIEQVNTQEFDMTRAAALITINTQPTGKKPTKSPEPPAANNPQGANMDITQFLAFLENHPEAKAFFTAYQAENRVDFEKIPLAKLLEKAPMAKAEHDQIVTDAKAALESEKINKADVKFIAGILSSEAYSGNKALSEAGKRALCQETTIDIFKMFVAQADQFNEMKKDLQIKQNQPGATIGDHTQGAGGGKSKDEVLAQAQAQGQSMGTAKREDK